MASGSTARFAYRVVLSYGVLQHTFWFNFAADSDTCNQDFLDLSAVWIAGSFLLVVGPS